ncbi:MAG: PAS domain-containing protein [Desulfobacterales bacterium]|nr:PAS domain-containing protein [Desulfobacterales bacterium]
MKKKISLFSHLFIFYFLTSFITFLCVVTFISDHFSLMIFCIGYVSSIFVSSILSYISSKKITAPLENLKIGAKLFASGELKNKLLVPDIHEIGEVVKVMNEVAASLHERIRTIIDQKNKFEAVLSSMTEGVIAIDLNEKIISANPAAKKIFRCLNTEIEGRNLHEVIRYPGLHKFVKTSISSSEPIEEDIISFSVDEQILHTKSAPLKNSEDKINGILIVIDDVTQLRRLENVRRDFASNVSHEIKTPLTAIKGFVETLIHESIDNPDEVNRFLLIIAKHVNRLEAILEDLIRLSRIEKEAEQNEIKFIYANIKEVIFNAVQTCMVKAKASNIAINVHCDEHIFINMDPVLIEQAFFNIIDNAIKYSQKGNEVDISVDSSNNHVIIRFKDNGVGIENKHLARLFERFYRVDKSRSRNNGGTGLGLAIVKHIVQAHGGKVEVNSTIGKGTTFSICLPKLDLNI